MHSDECEEHPQFKNAERYRRMRAAAIQDRVAATEDEFDKLCDESLAKKLPTEPNSA